MNNAENENRNLKAKVLLVDDRKENLKALEALITDEDADILLASSGRDALELLLLHDFALALLDVQMPDMNGFELAELMRGSEKSKTVPIIFVTAGAIDSKHTFRGYEAGAVDFLYKPLDPRIVHGKVHIFLELDRQKKLLSLQLEEMNCAKDQLKIAKETAEAANLSKSAFLANMSHEIRTPLGAILGFAEMLKDSHLPESKRESYLDIVLRNGNILSKLIDDILDLAKVEAGKLDVEKIVFALPDLIRDVVSIFDHRAREKGLKFEVEFQSEIPDKIASDPLRLRQILTNIIGNAIKFTPSGSVKLVVYCQPISESENCRLFFEVQDTGVGISEDQRLVLFQSFSQADSSTTRKFGGTGLGLILSRRLSTLLGGNVHLSAQAPERGSTFIIEIEAKHVGLSAIADQKASAQATSPDHLNLENVKVLVVEDSPDNQVLVNLFLSNEGASVDFADNGRDGVEKALGGDFDVVLMDIQMPIMDGHTATKELRKKGYLKPIIALSAHAMKEERDKSLEIGCNEHLIKPIDRAKLIEAVAYFSQAK